jgi:acyl-CoA thioesterase-1
MIRILYTIVATSVLLLSACGRESSTEVNTEAERKIDVPVSPPTPDSADNEVVQPDRPVVLYLGDSITAGYGLDPELAFPAILQTRADSSDLDVLMVNGGLSGETSAGGLRRIDWMLRQRVDVLVLELGGNDGLRGIDLSSTRDNLQGIIDRTREAWPESRIIVAGMMMPPNLGVDYTTAFRDLYPALAEANDALLVPFLLEGVGGVEGMMQGDGIHPTAAGHQEIANLLWPYVLRALPTEG